MDEKPDQQKVLIDALNNYANNSSNPSIKRQNFYSNELISAIRDYPELPELVILRIVRIMVDSCFSRFVTRRYLRIGFKVIEPLLENYPLVTLKCLVESLSKFFVFPKLSITKQMAMSSILAAKCLQTACVYVHGKESEQIFTKKVIPLLANLAFYSCANEDSLHNMKKIFTGFINTLSLEKIQAFIKDESADFRLTLAVLVVLPSSAFDDSLNAYFVDVYAKNILLGKQRLSDFLLNSFASLFMRLNSSDLQPLLSIIKKAILRNPEITVWGLESVLKFSKFDNSFAEEVYKLIIPCLMHSSEEIRECWSKMVFDLVKNSKDDVLLQILQLLFATLKGEYGKLNNIVQKKLVLKTIEDLSEVKEQCDEEFNFVCNEFASFIKTDGTENVIHLIWKTIAIWSQKLTCFPVSVLPFIKNSFQSTVSRAGALNFLVYAFRKLDFAGFPKDLLKDVEKIWDTNASPIEFICSSVLLLKLTDSEDHKKSLFQSVVQNHNFCSEKFVTSIDKFDAMPLLFLYETLFEISQKLEIVDVKMDFTTFFMVLFWPKYSVRKMAENFLKRIVALCGIPFCDVFLNDLYGYISSGKIDEQLIKIYQRNSELNVDEKNFVNGKHIIPILKILLYSISRTNIYLEMHPLIMNILTSALLICSSPRIVDHNGSLWNRWIIAKALSSYLQASVIIDRVFTESNKEIKKNALKMLLSSGIADQLFREELWEKVLLNFARIDYHRLLNVSDKALAIFDTPDGVLFNVNVIEENSDEALEAKNMRRENKAYKFKEQIFDLQLRKELAEKRRLEGKLSKRQEMAVEAELAREKKIRDDLKKLQDDCIEPLTMLQYTIQADPGNFMRSVGLFNSVVVWLLKSKLVSKYAFEVFRAFRDAAFEPSEDYLHELVLHVSARVLGSFYLEDEWCKTPLSKQLERTLSLLTDRCIVCEAPFLKEEGKVTNEEKLLLEMEEEDDVMNISKFMFVYPTIEAVVLSSSQPYNIRANVIQFMQSVFKPSIIKEKEMPLLPLTLIYDCLMDLIVKSSVDLASLAFSLACSLTEILDKYSERISVLVQGVEAFLAHLESPDEIIRHYALQLLILPDNFYAHAFGERGFLDFINYYRKRIFIARFDSNENCKKIADQIWKKQSLDISCLICEELIEEAVSDEIFMHSCASKAFGEYISYSQRKVHFAIRELNKLYTDFYEIRAPQKDKLGHIIEEARDHWEKRLGVAHCLLVLSDYLSDSSVIPFIEVVVPRGIDDRNSECRQIILNAAMNAIALHGKSKKDELLVLLEDMLNSLSDGQEYDNLRQGLVILIGTLSQHIDPNDAKVRTIASLLLQMLSTPSQQVQEAVSECLHPLMSSIKTDSKKLMSNLLDLLVYGESYGERRGAAYGIAAFIKGLGMVSLREFELMKRLQQYLQDKQNPKCREGALLALEILCKILGRLFEPYIIQILPPLLSAFGDLEMIVRRAAQDTAREMMAMLSILPSLLRALDEESWRTKCASVELLGAMSYCAPKQLSSCLPNIVPKIIEVLADSHSKVQNSGEKALKQIASVIRNPEILSISVHLLAGLIDPSEKTFSSLQTIVNTRFVHYMDAASLALIMPIIHRAFIDRNVEARRMAAQIIASIYSLTASKDIEPYLPDLIPGLQETLLDPIPEVRAVAAKAFGALIHCSSSNKTVDMKNVLTDWLNEKLASTTSSVDRSGAAQGLAEVTKAIGTSELEELMKFVSNKLTAKSSGPEVRDGCMLLFIYLPLAFGKDFMNYLPKVIPSVLNALADENEYVRESALKAGQRMIVMYSSEARQLLLPQLQEALVDTNWRIRYAAVNLIGDFLFTVSGISGKMSSSTMSDDDTVGTENIGRAIIKSLGSPCRDEILAGIYLARHDTAIKTKQSANHVWKVVVANTPRTVKEIVKPLFEILFNSLGNSDYDRQQIGLRCLGDLTKKLGERIIVDILSFFSNADVSSLSVEQRKGIVIAIREIVENTNRDTVCLYARQLLEPIKVALCDEKRSVQKLAAENFSALYQSIGHSVFDIVIGPLLDSPVKDYALDGLTDVMRLNSRQMLPYVLPRLTRPPVNTVVLSILSAATGDSLDRNIGRILDIFLKTCDKGQDFKNILTLINVDLCSEIILNVTNIQSVSVIINTLLQNCLVKKHVESSLLLYRFVSSTSISLTDLVRPILSGTLMLYSSPVEAILENAIQTLICLLNHFDASQTAGVLSTLRQTLNTLQNMSQNNEILPGFCHPKGLQPLLPMTREFILSSNMDSRQNACEIIATLIKMSSAAAIKAHVVATTGPLIRIFGERSAVQVKIPILNTILELLDKVGVMLRPFFPQLQSTFLKALADPSSKNIRLLSGGGISRLIVIYPKPEVFATDVVNLLQTTDDGAVNETVMLCLRSVISQVHEKLSKKLLDDVIGLIKSLDTDYIDNRVLVAAASLYGEVKLRLDALDTVFLDELSKKDNVKEQQMASIALEYLCSEHAVAVLNAYPAARLNATLISAMQSGNQLVSCATIRATAFILICMEEMDVPLLTALARAVNNPSDEVKLVVALALSHIGQKDLSVNEMKAIVPMMINGTKESNAAVRAACERALLFIFKLQRDNSVFECYSSTTEGAVKAVLLEVYKVLQRSKHSTSLVGQCLTEIPSVL